MSSLHKATRRDYLSRVNDPEFPKAKAAKLAKLWGFDYWDGDRRINYGGYHYIPGRWTQVAKELIKVFDLQPGDRVLDIGCGKGFLLHELHLLVPGLQIFGIDISEYALENCHPEVQECLERGCASDLRFEDKYFKLALSINTLHNLSCEKLEFALLEISRVSNNQYICVEAYRTEEEKVNLMYWQVTCHQILTTSDWEWWFSKTDFDGFYSFIYFE